MAHMMFTGSPLFDFFDGRDLIGLGARRAQRPSARRVRLQSDDLQKKQMDRCVDEQGAVKLIVSKDELTMQRAIVASLDAECAEPAAPVASSSGSASSSSSSSSSIAPCGSSHSMAKSSSADFKRLPSVASWLMPVPCDCIE